MRRPVEQQVELNLIPIMNLFTALIPFLLLSAAFFHLSTIQVTIPVASTDVSVAEEPPKKTEPTVTMNVRVTPESFAVNAEGSDGIDRAALEKFRRTISRARLPPGAPARARAQKSGAVRNDEAMKSLQDLAASIKEAYPQSETAVVVPDGEIVYGELVDILDALRKRRQKKATGAGASSTETQALFGRVVLGREAGAPAAAPGSGASETSVPAQREKRRPRR